MLSRRYIFIFSILCLSFLGTADAEARKRDRKARHSADELVVIEPDALVAKAVSDSHAQVEAARTLSKGQINTAFREGIDVSHYQGDINWDQVAGSGKVSYAYLKATEGASLVDDTYERNLREARRVGLSVGSYHFYRPNVDWKKQFENLTSVVKPSEQDLIPIIDIEHKGNVSDKKFISDLTAFLNRVTEFYGKKPLLYTFHNFYNRHLAGHFKDYHWMIARYRSDHPTLDDGQDYVIWQYTSTGRIAGVKGNVDRSRLMGDYTLNHLQM